MGVENGADRALVPAASSQQVVSTKGFDHGESPAAKPMKSGAPELAYIAQAVFRGSFSDDEDEQIVLQKWCEWEADRTKAIRVAHFVIKALGGWGSVSAALAKTRGDA